jgi:hypothetical protein
VILIGGAVSVALIVPTVVALTFVGFRTALLVFVVLVALLTEDKHRRRTALTVLRIMSPALSVKLGNAEITRGDASQKRVTES